MFLAPACLVTDPYDGVLDPVDGMKVSNNCRAAALRMFPGETGVAYSGQDVFHQLRSRQPPWIGVPRTSVRRFGMSFLAPIGYANYHCLHYQNSFFLLRESQEIVERGPS